MSGHVHISSFDEDDDGWPTVECTCGFAFGPVPDMETAADVWGDHQHEVARAAVMAERADSPPTDPGPHEFEPPDPTECVRCGRTPVKHPPYPQDNTNGH